MGSNEVAGFCLEIQDQGNVPITSSGGVCSKFDGAILQAMGPPTALHHGTGAWFL
jgi:hypothetical protein